MENEILFGNLCIQENLCISDDIDNAVKTQKKLQKIGINKRVGEILIARGIISPQQLDAVLKIQYKMYQTDEEAVLGQLAVNNEIITRKQLESAQNILKSRFKEEGSKKHNLLDVLVELGFADQSKINSLNKLYNQAFGKERLYGFCAHCQQKVENIKGRCSVCGEKLPPLTKRGDTRIFRLMPDPEPSNVITERLKTIKSSAETSARTRIRSSTRLEARESSRIRELPEKTTNSRKLWIGLIIFLSGLAIGIFLRFSISKNNFNSYKPIDFVNDKSAISDDVTEVLTIDELIPFRNLEDEEKGNLLKALGFMPLADGRWFPKSYVAEMKNWQNRKGIDLSRLRPFEFDGNHFYAIVNKLDSATYMLEFSDGTSKDYRAVDVLKQIETYKKYRELLENTKPENRNSEFYEKLGDFCNQNAWFIEARNNYIRSIIIEPKNKSVRSKLHFILPGETKTHLDGEILAPGIDKIPINPPLPYVELDIPIKRSLVDTKNPEMLDWLRYSFPLTASDLVNEDAWNIDIERARKNKGEVMYLGYWLRKKFSDNWLKHGKSFKKTVLEDDVFVMCDEFQINNEVLNTARILYQLSRSYFSKNAGEYLGKISLNTWQNFSKKHMICVIGKGIDTRQYRWLSTRFELDFVKVDDWRRLENFIFPLLRAYFKIYIKKSGIKAVSEWIEEGMQSEFAYDFLDSNGILFQKNFEIAKALESWRRLKIDDIQNIHSMFNNSRREITADLADICWGVSRVMLKTQLRDRLFLYDNDTEYPTKSLLFINAYKKELNEILSNLNYECIKLHKEIRNAINLNPGNVSFLTNAFNETLNRNRTGVLNALNITENIEKYSALEIWTLIGLSAYFDELYFGTQVTKEKLKEHLTKVFTDNPAIQKLINSY